MKLFLEADTEIRYIQESHLVSQFGEFIVPSFK